MYSIIFKMFPRMCKENRSYLPLYLIILILLTFDELKVFVMKIMSIILPRILTESSNKMGCRNH